MTAVVDEEALSEYERAYLEFAGKFDATFIAYHWYDNCKIFRVEHNEVGALEIDCELLLIRPVLC